jgi:polyhydroxyalkanoate synthesis regulator phasin
MANKTPRSKKSAHAGSTLKSRADQAVDAIRQAPAAAGDRVQALLESGKPALERAQALASEAGRTISKRAQAIRKDIAHRASGLGSRVDAERKNVGKRVDGAVKATLASLNIPTRSEINLLTRRVEELSKKIDGLKKKAKK